MGVDRMPVILKSKDAIDSWLNDDLSENSVQKLTQPYESPDLVSMKSIGWLLGKSLQVEFSLLICAVCSLLSSGACCPFPFYTFNWSMKIVD